MIQPVIKATVQHAVQSALNNTNVSHGPKDVVESDVSQGCTPPPNAAAPVKFATPPRRVLSRRCENLKSKILANIKFLNFDNMQHI